jgi:iron complex transport system substrate-binding protein
MAQLARAKIPVFDYRHGGLDHITTTIRTLGERTGRASPAQQLASDIEQRIRALRAKTSSLRKPRTLLVFGRERGALRGIYASGGRGFLHEMLDAAGGVNVFADVQAESVQASSEMVLARAPEAILEIRSADLEREQDLSVWKTLSSLPAVRDNRIHLLAGQSVVVPGPLVTDGIERMARALHPALFK